MGLKYLPINQPINMAGFYILIPVSDTPTCSCEEWSPTNKQNEHGWGPIPSDTTYEFETYNVEKRMAICNNCSRKLVLFRYQLEEKEKEKEL